MQQHFIRKKAVKKIENEVVEAFGDLRSNIVDEFGKEVKLFLQDMLMQLS